MAIRKYRDFVLVASSVEKDVEQFSVRVFTSPVGEGKPTPTGPTASILQKDLGYLERRKLDVGKIIGLGENLANILLPVVPNGPREFFTRSMDKLKPNEGLRLRLRLDPNLVDVPWEYMYIQRGGGEKDTTGFLALDPRVSIVRHEEFPVSVDLDTKPKPRRLLAALASPEDNNPLDLSRERENLVGAFRGKWNNIELDFLENATAEGLNEKLIHNVDIFHFGGHGTFKQTGLGVSYRSGVGEGAIMLIDKDGKSAPMQADQLAVNLRGCGVQLVVLGACQTGRRDGQNVWSGVVAALMKAEIPAAVAMQYTIWDDASIAFARSFYQVLAAGLPLDYAVCKGRQAVYNLCHSLRGHVERSMFWRDWGVPVLYSRAAQDFVLPALTEPDQRDAVEVYYLGMEAAYRRDYDKALNYFRQAVQVDPEYSDAFKGIVWLQQSLATNDVQRKDYEAATVRLKEASAAARQTDPLDSSSLALRGFVFKTLAQAAEGNGDRVNREKYYSEAARLFEQALERDPEDASAQLGLGNVEYGLGNIDAAIAACSRAVALLPSYTAAYHDLALAYEGKMEDDSHHFEEWCQRALAAWREAYRLAPGDPGFPNRAIMAIDRRISKLEQRCSRG